MAYTLDFAISLGSSKTGLTLNAQIVDTSGSNVGDAITAGFTEVGTGTYLLHCTTVPDAHRGGIKIYESGVPGTILAFGSINPEEAEYAGDILTDTAEIGVAGAGLTEIANAVWDEVLTGATHDVAASAGKRLRLLGAASIASGTAEAGAAATITLEDGEVSTTDHIYNQNLIAITGGTGIGQVRMIVEYVGSTRVATVDQAWEVTPAVDSEYQIMAFSGVLLSQHGQAVAATASTITLSATALTDDASYVGSMVFVTTGTGVGQVRLITAYVGDTKVATVSPDWEVTPDATSVYKVIPVGRSIVESLGAAAKAEVNAEADTAISDAALATATALTTHDGKLDTVDGIVDAILLDTGTDGVVVAAASKTGYQLSAAGIDSILDEVVEGTYTMRQMLRLVAAVLAGKSSGGGTASITFRNLDDDTDRVVATVDTSGNRTTVVLDVS